MRTKTKAKNWRQQSDSIFVFVPWEPSTWELPWERETTARRELAWIIFELACVLIPFPFPFERPPRRLFSRWLLSPPQRLPLGIPIKIAILEKIESALSFPFSPASSPHKKGNLSKAVSERRTSTGSETFSLNICLNANKFVLLSSFTLKTTICPKIWAKTLPRNVKSLLPVNVLHSKTKRGLRWRKRWRQWICSENLFLRFALFSKVKPVTTFRPISDLRQCTIWINLNHKNLDLPVSKEISKQVFSGRTVRAVWN